MQDPSALWEKSSCYRDPASSPGALLKIPFYSTFTLLNFQERGLAVRLLPLLEQACGQVGDNPGEQVDGKGDCQGVEELAEEQARLIGCLREAVIMEAARSCL